MVRVIGFRGWDQEMGRMMPSRLKATAGALDRNRSAQPIAGSEEEVAASAIDGPRQTPRTRTPRPAAAARRSSRCSPRKGWSRPAPRRGCGRAERRGRRPRQAVKRRLQTLRDALLIGRDGEGAELVPARLGSSATPEAAAGRAPGAGRGRLLALRQTDALRRATQLRQGGDDRALSASFERRRRRPPESPALPCRLQPPSGRSSAGAEGADADQSRDGPRRRLSWRSMSPASRAASGSSGLALSASRRATRAARRCACGRAAISA